MLDAAIFNVAIGNADARGKNYSLLYRREGSEFALLYDLLCTVAYPEIHGKFAMKVATRARLEAFTATTWEEFAREIGMTAPFVRRRAAAMAELILGRIEAVADDIALAGFESAELHRVVEIIKGRARALRELVARKT